MEVIHELQVHTILALQNHQTWVKRCYLLPDWHLGLNCACIVHFGVTNIDVRSLSTELWATLESLVRSQILSSSAFTGQHIDIRVSTWANFEIISFNWEASSVTAVLIASTIMVFKENWKPHFCQQFWIVSDEIVIRNALRYCMPGVDVSCRCLQ